ncbi:MAG TPA: DUF4203 domain-containing protein [Vicinamibacterales bacterium]|nr:DUF4203 domain-containing protein [Vicinamibacterales bacterium]
MLVAAGALAAFFGYRLFRVVLGSFGFILGAFVASSTFGPGSALTLVLAAVVGGLAGAALLMTAYFLGVALVGAAVGAVTAHLVVSAAQGGEPGVLMVILFSAVGAIAATYLQRYFIIVGTGFGGAWTLLVGALVLFGDKVALAAAASRDVWVFYPLDPAPGRRWVTLAWIVLGIAGVVTQLGWTGGENGRVVRRNKK